MHSNLLSQTQTTRTIGSPVNLIVVEPEILLEYVEIATRLPIFLLNALPTVVTVAKGLDILLSIVLCKPHDVLLVELVDNTTCTGTALIISVMNAMNKDTLL